MVCVSQKSKRLLSSMAGLLLAAAPGIAQVYNADFNSGVPAGSIIPAGPATDANEARVDGGYLKLTDAINSSCGFYYVNDFSGGAVAQFVATFDVSLFGSTCCGTGGDRPADGLSFNLVPASSLNPSPAYIASELGLSEGLAVTIDSWDNAAPGPDGPNIKVKWQGSEVGVFPFQPSQSPAGATTAAAAAKHVTISLHGDGKIDVTYGDTVAFHGLQTPYSAAAIGAPAWVLTARTGGANDNHWIDNLNIVVPPTEKVLVAAASTPWAFNDTTLTSQNLHGTGWELPAYDTNSAPGWQTGTSLFGNDSAGLYDPAGSPFAGHGINGFETVLNRGSSDRATFYFRTKFNWSGSTAGVTLNATAWVDDGIVAYLNGAEVSRIRIPAGPVTWDTLGENPPTEGAPEFRTWDSTGLVQGENTIAVELHQSGLGSSDAAMAIQLTAVAAQAPVITDPVEPTNRVVLANRTTTLVCGATGSPAVSYQWVKDGVDIDGATSSTYTIAQMSATDAGSYYCRVSNSQGTVNSRTAVVGYNFDDSAPSVAEVSGSGTFDSVTVGFNEIVDQATAEDSFNYTITDGGGNTLAVNGAVLSPNRKSVKLATDPQTPDTVYTVKVVNVADAAGNALDDTVGSSGSFRSWTSGLGNGVLFETYTVGGRSTIDNLITSQAVFPNSPRERFLLSGFDSRLAYADDSHEDYAGRLRGVFIPPVSGRWYFHLNSDDPGRLWINPNGPDAAGKQVVANEPSCCGGIPASGTKKSGAYELQAGRAYYVELVYWEYGGGDYGQAAVQLEGDPNPTTANLRDSLVGAGAAPAGIGGPINITSQPASISVLANNVVTFSVAASNPNSLPLFYQWKRDGADIPGANSPSLTIGPVTTADSGAQFSVVVSVIGSTVTSDLATLTVTEDTTAPSVVAAKGSTDLHQVILTMSEFVGATEANDAFNYEVAGNESVSAVLGADNKTITVTLRDALTPDTDYTINVSGLRDLSGNTMAAGSASFHTYVIAPGFALSEFYFGLSTSTVALTDVTGSPKYPGFPDLKRYRQAELNTFDEFEGYGARISGWITAPVSGKYNFFMSSDDNGALYLSTDSSPANLQLIASEPVWNGRRDWLGVARRNATAPENRSSTAFPDGIELTAGQMYYFEALVKEGGGGDNLGFAWQGPGDNAPASGTPGVSGIYLSTLVDPSAASLQITSQPANQVFVIANDTLANENFNAGGGGFVVETPDAQFATPWTLDAAGNWVVKQQAAEINNPMTSYLTSPEYTITKPGGVTLTMKHRWSMEGGLWDGGIIQISVNGGAFTDVPSTALSGTGYNGTVLPNSRSRNAGKLAFVNDSPATYQTTTASLGSFNTGDKVRIRFLYAGDTNTHGTREESWSIDELLVNQGGGSAQSVTFAVAIQASKASETTPTTYYQWMRDNGAGFKPVPDGNGPSLTFTPILADNGAKFKCEVYILGAHKTSDVALLTVATPNTPPRFTAGPNQAVDEDAGSQTVDNWATDIIHHSVSGGLAGANFDALPVGATLGGNAAISGGILHLTDAVNSQQSSFVTPASPTPVDSLVVTFKARIGGGTCCGDRTADGWGVTIGDVSVPVSFPVAAEEGAAVTGGFSVNFDSWDNGGLADDDAHTAPNVDVKVDGNVVAYQAFDGVREGGRAPSGPLINDPATGAPMSYKTGDQFTNIRIQLDSDGTLDVTFKGVKVVDNVQTGLTLPLNNARVAFGARTGGANDNHWIDDLLIVGSYQGAQTVVYPPQSTGIPEAGQTVHFLVENDNPSLFSVQPAVSPIGTLTYTPAANANGVAHVTVRAQDDGGTAYGGNDTSAAATFTITVRPVNDCPTLAAVAPIAVNAGASANGQLVGADVDGDALTYSVATAPAHGTLTVNPSTGAFTYTAAAGYNGPDSFGVKVSDGTCNSAVVTASVTVSGGAQNHCPVAVANVGPGVDVFLCGAETVIIAGDYSGIGGTCTDGTAHVQLDGTDSRDADGTALTYSWFMVRERRGGSDWDRRDSDDDARYGMYTIRLVVDDGQCHDSMDVDIHVITPAEGIAALIDDINTAGLGSRNRRPLISLLKSASACYDRCLCESGVKQLNAFINKVRAQIQPQYPGVASDLTAKAQALLDATKCGNP